MLSKLFKIFSIFVIIFSFNISIADTPYYLDFKYVLNQSTAGKKAQETLKKKLDQGIKKISTTEKSLLEEEKKIIQQKKLIKPEEYKKKVEELRSKVSKLQKERNTLLQNIAKQRGNAKKDLLKNLNPILENYMKEKNIIMIIDKKNLLLADKKLDITKEITNLLNQKLKSVKLD
tara:strand:- start:811 stop:1335 length:525 start_codon:yes stop_codon:yes gene_type:complete